MRNYSVILLLLFLSVFPCKAQFDLMPSVRESPYGLVRTNLSVGYDHTFGAVPDNIQAGVSYQFIKKQWLTLSANARFNTLWSNFDDSQLSLPCDAWNIGLNGNHTYGSVGFTASAMLPLFRHVVATFVIGNAEWSNHCFGRISGIVAGVYMFKLDKDTQMGVGPLFLVHTASKIPVFPVFIIRHKFSEQLALNFYGGIFGIELKPSDNDKLVFGADVDTRSFYFKPGVDDLPDKCRFTMTLFRPYIKYERRLAPNFYGGVQTGVAFKLSGRVTSATRSKRYIDFEEDPAFFLKASVSYSL